MPLMFMNEKFSDLKQFLQDGARFAVVCHRRPDSDAIGSLLAIAAYLSSSGRPVACFCLDEIPRSLDFLLSGTKINRNLNQDWETADMVVLVDCGDLNMAGLTPEQLAGKRTAVVDHHITNPQYGDINLVEPNTSATAEILFNYFGFVNFAFDKPAATCLLAGIYGDTDGFSNLGTTPSSFFIAAELLKRGANFKEVTANILGNKTLPALKLWGRALERVKLDKENGVATTVIRQQDMEECRAKADDAEGIANLFNHLADAKISLVLREQADGTVRGSLRTADELIDVSEIAKMKGGGGHKKAAGFTAKGRVVERENGWKIVD